MEKKPVHCPYCKAKIGLISTKVNWFAKETKCPQCEKPIKLGLNWPVFAIFFLPTIALAFVVSPIFEAFGSSGFLAVGLFVGLLTALTIKIHRARIP